METREKGHKRNVGILEYVYAELEIKIKWSKMSKWWMGDKWHKEAQEHFRKLFQGHVGNWCTKSKENIYKEITTHCCMDTILLEWKWWSSKYHWGMGKRLQWGFLKILRMIALLWKMRTRKRRQHLEIIGIKIFPYYRSICRNTHFYGPASVWPGVKETIEVFLEAQGLINLSILSMRMHMDWR